MTNEDRKQLAREIVQAHVPPAMANVVLDAIDEPPQVSTTGTEMAADPFLTVQEVAEIFSSPGRRVHPSTVYRMIDRGELAEQRIGRSRRVRRSEVQRYLADNEHLAPKPEPKARVVRRSADEARVLAEHSWLEAI
jgi:excisionase family DNA binding protein